MALRGEVAAVLLLSTAGCVEAPSRIEASHFVLISIDTLRRDHVSVYGYGRDTTPCLREFARAAIVFDSAIAANTNTAPSHGSMLTGLYPHHHGILQNGYELTESIVTVAQLLGETHRSAAFVSGYPLQRMMSNLDRGFDHYDDDFGEGQWQRTAEATIARVRTWLETERDDPRPLFLFVHLYDPHHPYEAPEPFARRFLPPGQTDFRFPGEASYESFWQGTAPPEELEEYVSRYDGEIAYADHGVAQLFALLRESGYWDDAAILVISDHGETLAERAAPFTHGDRVYDEQIRVPLILRLPGDRFGGTRVSSPVHHVDVAPTILGLLAPRATLAADGLSLLDRLAPDDAVSRPMFSTALAQSWRVPEIEAEFDSAILVASIRTPSWKLVSYPGVDGEILQLLDLQRDPGEKRNIAPGHPHVVDTLRAKLEDWRGGALAGPRVSKPELTPEQERGLRALGYVD